MRLYTYRHVVTFDETNVVGNVYFAHYVRWQGHCRELFLAERAPGVVRAVRAGTLALVTASCHMDYHSECFALDVIDVEMSLRQRTGNRIGMDFVFRRDAREVASGSQVVACLRVVDGNAVPVPIPAELSDALDSYE
ncbi:thioesterase family protein [Nocardia sp. NRRL S-836]|uniref:acyl-CoA thioesterase n=1 Tax=Nocardia sp. NRRL S-836 TaxID=1519492 RepID=UPI0006ADB70D|nr:acyl-CoA thioesterase [Nocardia sp. NRRL S-836]KOV86329.1 4-hydroxybenzoyl-CoA thioesterase [Nocardia sp. NRRL S-836]